MATSLSDSWAKFYRGDEHRNALNAEIDRLLKGDGRPAVEMGFHFEPDTRSYLVVLAKVVDLNPFGLIFGDALQNYRAALDLLIYRLVTINKQPIDRQMWPASRSEEAWKTALGLHLAGVNPTHINIIEKYQPKQSGDRADEHPLFVLTNLSNLDKHQVITPLPISLQQMRFTPVNVGGCRIAKVDPLLPQEPRSIEPGAELMRIWLEDVEPNHNVEMNAQLALEPGLPNGRPLGVVLHEIRSRVVNVLSEFERIL